MMFQSNIRMSISFLHIKSVQHLFKITRFRQRNVNNTQLSGKEEEFLCCIEEILYCVSPSYCKRNKNKKFIKLM